MKKKKRRLIGDAIIFLSSIILLRLRFSCQTIDRSIDLLPIECPTRSMDNNRVDRHQHRPLFDLICGWDRPVRDEHDHSWVHQHQERNLSPDFHCDSTCRTSTCSSAHRTDSTECWLHSKTCRWRVDSIWLFHSSTEAREWEFASLVLVLSFDRVVLPHELWWLCSLHKFHQHYCREQYQEPKCPMMEFLKHQCHHIDWEPKLICSRPIPKKIIIVWWNIIEEEKEKAVFYMFEPDIGRHDLISFVDIW